MKIAILSTGPKLYSTRRLKEAAEARGHAARVLHTLKFAIHVEEGRPELFYRGRRLGRYDAAIPRIGASITFFGCAVVRQFEQMGVFTLSPSQAIAVSRDKLRAFQILSRQDVGMPPTAFVRDRADVLPAVERLGGAPVILKLLEGTQGVGVILAETIQVAEAIIETLQSARQNVLVQKFVAESRGVDVRAFVVGDRVVAAMRRRARGREWRSNVHRGGAAEKIALEPAYERTAVRAAHVLGLRVAGVDMLETRGGPQVLEVNSSPGLEGIEAATGVDVAGAMIEQIEEMGRLPEVDLRERLRLGKGYAIAEIPVPEGSRLAGRRLADAELRAEGLLVLSLTREGAILPNPEAGERLRAGDRLLCYGPRDALGTLLSGRGAARAAPRAALRGRR